jgi:hypothetical protein
LRELRGCVEVILNFRDGPRGAFMTLKETIAFIF